MGLKSRLRNIFWNELEITQMGMPWWVPLFLVLGVTGVWSYIVIFFWL